MNATHHGYEGSQATTYLDIAESAAAQAGGVCALFERKRKVA
jgi:hypothetical protein